MSSRALAGVSLAAIAIAAGAIACFPDYDFSAAGGAPGGPDATIDGAGPGPSGDGAASDANGAMDAGDGGSDGAASTGDASPPPFDASDMVRVPRGSIAMQGAAATLSHDFYVDRYEATVGRFKAFVDAGSPVPCDGGACPLDPGGPYAAMTWDPSWNAFVGEPGYTGSGCGGARDTTVTHATYDDADPTYPIGCVSWYQAVAMCAFEKKRLLTETEWEYVASGHDDSRLYPWGSTPPVGCGQAIWRDFVDAGAKNGCNWPKPVGSARDGGSLDGVLDLTGSVYEWVWDEVLSYAGGTDPIVGRPDAGVRGDRGGSFAADDEYLTVKNRDETSPDAHYTDIGFRCAKTVP